MKSLLLVFVAAATAAPEADPAFAYSVGAPLVYHTYTHALPAVTYTHAPVTYTLPAAGCQNVHGALVPCNGAVPFLAAAVAPTDETGMEAGDGVEAVERKKREAEAEAAPEADAEADPWLYYSALGHHAYAPYAYSYGFPYAYHAGYAHPYSAYAPEADAEAD